MKRSKVFFNIPKIKEVLRFCLVGGLATILQIVLYMLLSNVFDHNISLFISYVVCLIINFIMTVYFTFKVKPSFRKGTGFLISHAINFFLQFILLNFFILFDFNKQLAIIPTLSICIPINFILVRYAIIRL